MKYNNKKIAGSLLFIGGVQSVLGIIIAEVLYPGYSTSLQWVSELGIGDSAIVFNSSMFLLGVLGIAASYFIQRAFNFKVVTFLFAMASIGSMGVGLFTMDTDTLLIHGIFSYGTFIFSGLSAIASYKILKPPLSYLSIILGIFSLLAFALPDLGLGRGGIERMIIYPALLWLIGLGGHLIGDSRDTSESTKG